MGPTVRRLFVSLLGISIATAVLVGVWIGPEPGSRVRLWFGLAGVVMVVAVSSYALLTPLARRLKALEDAAGRLASGDLAARAPVEHHDDVAGLARSLNEIAKRIERDRSAFVRGRDESAAALNYLPQGVALIAPDLSIRHANARFWESVEVEAPSHGAHLSATRQPALQKVVEDARHTGRAVTREISLYLATRVDVEVTAAPVGARATPEAWLLTIEDLSPERRAAEIRREFVANVSHELKTPLTSILGYTETLLQGGLHDEDHRVKFVETIRAQALRLEALVDDLLSLADLERPDAELELKDWDVGEMLREMAEPFDDLATRRGLRFELGAAPGTRIRCDRKRLELAIRNLIDNAVKYTEKGWVRVQLAPGERSVRISVTDSGKGIAAEHLARIFERFYRADQARARALGGTGLGLSIVKHAVQLHGGTVGVESEPDGGSTFWLELPVSGPVS